MNGKVYIGEVFSGVVYALDAVSGARVWSYTTGGGVSSSPSVANGVVYVGSDDNNVYALDANTGALVWTYSTGGAVEDSPAIVNGVLYISSVDGNLYALKLSEAVPPVAGFTASPLSGRAPLTVNFTDISTGYPNVWAWFFGDENYGGSWSEPAANANWQARYDHGSVALPDGSIVLIGGIPDNTQSLGDVWRSTDKGATWQQVYFGANWTRLRSMGNVVLPDGSIVMMGGYDGYSYNNETWRSMDKGATWTDVNASSGWFARQSMSSVVLPDGSIVLMGGDASGTRMHDVWRSADNGATWTEVNANALWAGRFGQASVALPDGNIVLMGGDVANGAVYSNDVWRSTDKGTTWIEVNTTPGWSPRVNLNAVAMPDGSVVLMGGLDNNYGNPFRNDTWRSTDDGATWTEVNTGADWPARQAASSVVLPDGSIVMTGGEITGYNAVNDVWRLALTGSSAQNPTHVYTTPGTYTVTLQASNVGGYNTTQKTGYITVTSGAVAPVAAFSGTPRSGSPPLSVSFADLSTNTPTGWAWYFGDEGYLAPWTLVNANAAWTARADASSVVLPDGHIVLTGGYGGYPRDEVWRSADNGTSWSEVNTSPGWDARSGQSTVVMPDKSIVLTGGYNGNYMENDVWRSTDEGTTWTEVNASAGWTGRAYHSSVALPDGNLILMGGQNNHEAYLNDVWRSTDEGSTWTEVNASAGWTPRQYFSGEAIRTGASSSWVGMTAPTT